MFIIKIVVNVAYFLTNPEMKTILIGVTGASSSGKSTLAYLMKDILSGTEIIHEDDFFKLEKDVPFDQARNDRDWDCPDAIDIESMKQTLLVLKDPKKFESNPKANVKLNKEGYYDYAMISTEPPRNDVNFKNSKSIVESLRIKIRELIKPTEEFRMFLLDGFLLLHDVELMKLFDISLFFKSSYETLKSRREKRIYSVEGSVWVDPPGYFDLFVWPGYYKYHKDIFIKGDDEPFVKSNGGELLPDFKKKFNVFEFINDDDSDANALITEVVNIVSSRILQV